MIITNYSTDHNWWRYGVTLWQITFSIEEWIGQLVLPWLTLSHINRPLSMRRGMWLVFSFQIRDPNCWFFIYLAPRTLMYAVQVILQMNNYTALFGNFLDNLFILLSYFSFLFVSQFSSHVIFIEQKQIDKLACSGLSALQYFYLQKYDCTHNCVNFWQCRNSNTNGIISLSIHITHLGSCLCTLRMSQWAKYVPFIHQMSALHQHHLWI